MNVTDLKAEYATLKVQLSEVNNQISALMKKNKRYNYSNIETTHSAETHELKQLIDLKKYIKEQMTSIENQLQPTFVKIKNYR